MPRSPVQFQKGQVSPSSPTATAEEPPGGPLPGALAARLRVSRMRAQTLLPAALPQCLPMHPLPASGLADGRHRLREHQAAADEMVSRHVSADPVEERSLGDGLGASVGSQLQHGLVAEAQADAGDEGTGRERPAGPHRAGGRCLPGGRNPRRQTRTRGAGQDAVPWRPCRSPKKAGRWRCG